MASQVPFDEDPEDSGSLPIHEMSVEQLLLVWEQSQKIINALEKAFSVSTSCENLNDRRITNELLRRSVQGVALAPERPPIPPEGPVPAEEQDRRPSERR